jgi:hypothetical protein
MKLFGSVFTFDDLSEVGADSSQKLNNGLVVAGSDTGLAKDGLTEVRVNDAQGKFLFFARFGRREMRCKEALQSGGHLVRCYGLYVFKRLFSSLERLVGSNCHHFGEAFQ